MGTTEASGPRVLLLTWRSTDYSLIGYALVLLDAVVMTRRRASAGATIFDITFTQADDSQERIHVRVPHWNRELAHITHGSRVLIGGQLRAGGRPRIIAGASTILYRTDDDIRPHSSPRVHNVERPWRMLASGKRVRVRAHMRGLAGITRGMNSLP
jgi:hypothetical protein